MGGRIFAAEDIEKIQIFQSVRPPKQFGEWSGTHFRSGVADWSYGESDVADVTDEYITTPSIASIPQNSGAIDLLCSEFHLVVKQLRQRHSNRPTLDVDDEYDVQMDFLLPVQELVIEKKTRSGLDGKELSDRDADADSTSVSANEIVSTLATRAAA
jgi:REase_DpnII-MboI